MRSNKYWEVWDKWHQMPQENLSQLAYSLYQQLSMINNESLNILDVGIGTGVITINLLKELNSLFSTSESKNIKVTCLDIDQDVKLRLFDNISNILKNAQIDIESNYIVAEKIELQIRWQDVLQLNEIGKFDIIILIDFLHYIPKAEHRKLLSMMKNLLSESGILIVGTSGGDIKLFVSDQAYLDTYLSSKEINEVENKFWKHLYSLIDWYPSHIRPTDFNYVADLILESNLQVVNKIYLQEQKKTSCAEIYNDLFRLCAMSYYRIFHNSQPNSQLKSPCPPCELNLYFSKLFFILEK